MDAGIFGVLFPQYGVYLDIVLTVIGAASAVATMTPNKSDDEVMQNVLNVVNVLGMNIGNSKNA